MGVSRVSLDKAVVREFGVSAAYLLEQRLLQEIKNDLLFTAFSIKGIAFRLHFSEPTYMIRFSSSRWDRPLRSSCRKRKMGKILKMVIMEVI